MSQNPEPPLTILIADDDQRVLDAFARNLAHAGHRVLTAAGGKEALEVYREAAPDVALVDIRMPEMDGLEVLKAIREQEPEAEVILTTGHGDKNLVISALRAGTSDFISKPIDQITLDAALQRVRRRLRLKEELRAAREALEVQIQERTAELQGSEARFKAVFEAAQDSIFIKDRALRYIEVNPAMAELFGRSAEDLLGQTDTEIFGATAGEHIQAMDAQVLQGEIVEVEQSKPVNGAVRTFHIVKVPIRDEAGEIVGLCGIARDITERKQMEMALQEHAESLERMVLAKARELELARRKGQPNADPRPDMELPTADSDEARD